MSPERFEQVQRALARNGKGSYPDRRDWPLSGGRMTSPCGRTYTGRQDNERGLARYKCQGRKWQRGGNWKPCGCPVLDADQIENRVWALVTGLLGDGERLRAYARKYLGVAGETAAAQAGEVATLDRQIGQLAGRLSAAYANGIKAGLDPDALAAATAEIEGELGALRTRRDDIAQWAAASEARQAQMDSLDVLGSSFRARARTMGPGERARVLDWLELKVTILDDSRVPQYQVSGWVLPHEVWNPQPGDLSSVPPRRDRSP